MPMATLALVPVESSTITPAADRELDKKWKSGLKVDIEKSLRSMVNEVKQNLNDTSSNALTSTVERERLSQEHVTPVKSIRNIAEEQFPVVLQRESQVNAARSSSSLQLPTHISQSYSSGFIPEHDTCPPQKPSEVSRFANRERDNLSGDTDKDQARYISSAMRSSTLNITGRSFERPKHSSLIEPDDMSRSTHSATDALDRRSFLRTANLSNRSVLPGLPSTPEEDALMPHIFTMSRRGSTTSTASDQAPSVLNFPSHDITGSANGWERDRALTMEQQWSAIYRARDRRRTTPYTYIEARASASAFERLDEDYPPPTPPSPSMAPSSRSVVPVARYSRSLGSSSSTVPMGYSYSSDSLRSTAPIGYSHFPPSSQLPLPTVSKPIAIKKLFSLDDDRFQSSPSPKDWDIPSHSPYETYESSNPPQTPDALPRSWQSSNLHNQLSSQDMHYGCYHIQHSYPYPDDLHDADLWEYDEHRLLQREESVRKREEEISLREQELKRREEGFIRQEEATQKEHAPRHEKETERVEDKIIRKELDLIKQEGANREGEGTEREGDESKWQKNFAKKKEEKAERNEAQGKKRANDLGRREEPATRRLEEEERRMTRGVMRKSEEVKRKEYEVVFKGQALRTEEKNIRRKEEQLGRRENQLTLREVKMERRYDQRKAQQEEYRKHIEERRRQSLEEKTKQSWKSLGYHSSRTTPPPRMSTSRSFSSSTGPWSTSDRDERMSIAACPPVNRGRSTSISTSCSSTTRTSSTRLSSTANSWRSNITKPQTPSAQKNQPRQMSPPDSNELHMSAAGSPTADRGRTYTSRSNSTWTSSSRLSSNASLHLLSTSNPQTSSAYKDPPHQMSTSKSFSSSVGPLPIPSRNQLHISATNSHRDRSESTSTNRSNTPWTFSRLSSITRQNKKVAPGAMEAGAMKEEDVGKGDGINRKETLAKMEVKEETEVRNITEVVRPEMKDERHIAHDLWPRSMESKREEEARLEAFRAVHTTEEEILKEEQTAQGKECDKPTPDNSGNMLPRAQLLLNTSASPSSEIMATEEEANQESPGSASDCLEDLTHELQGRSRYPIASGGFGDIWKCDLVKPSGTVQVAVKTIRSFESDNKELTRKNGKRVRRELKVWARLKHRSILPLCGVANDFGPHPAMVCPWADNGALTSFLERQQDVLSPQDKFSLLDDIALGLEYLHSESVVHGDLTGSNVLIYGNGRACLADFGLSTIILEFVGTSYFTSSIRGNVRWVAAELCEASEDDEVSLSTECDIYSFGSITLQVLTCKVPYYNVKNDILVLGQVIKGKKPEPPKESQIAPGLWEFIQRCWLPRASRPSVGEIVAFVECERQALLNRSTGI